MELLKTCVGTEGLAGRSSCRRGNAVVTHSSPAHAATALSLCQPIASTDLLPAGNIQRWPPCKKSHGCQSRPQQQLPTDHTQRSLNKAAALHLLQHQPSWQPQPQRQPWHSQHTPLPGPRRDLQRQQQVPQLQLLSDRSDKGSSSSSSSSSSSKAQPEPPSTSAGPPAQGSSGSSGPSQPGDSTQNASGSSSSKSAAVDSTDADIENEVDKALEKVWANLKKDLKKELPPEQASLIDEWGPTDKSTDQVFREMANAQLGPLLQSMGLQEDPYTFFLDLIRLALLFQLAAAGLVFYATELGLGGNAGDAFRAVGGLLLGYTLRLGIKVEQLAWPLYNGLVQLLISEGAVYEIPPATAEEQRDTLNKLGVVLAASFLVPKFVFGWENQECWQLVVPMMGGLFFFDVAYMGALLIKLMSSDSKDDGEQ